MSTTTSGVDTSQTSFFLPRKNVSWSSAINVSEITQLKRYLKLTKDMKYLLIKKYYVNLDNNCILSSFSKRTNIFQDTIFRAYYILIEQKPVCNSIEKIIPIAFLDTSTREAE